MSQVHELPLSYRPPLDGVRGLAVLGVFAWHLGGAPFMAGRLGVDVFFVLSGFLITTLLVDEHERAGSIDIRRFYARRAVRLFPALAFTAVLVTVVWLSYDGAFERDATLTVGLPSAVFYVAAWVAASGRSLGVMAHSWTLSVEEHFYLAWPLVLTRCLRRARPLTVVVLAFVAAAALRTIAGFAGSDADVLSYRPDLRAHQLLAGCAAGMLLRHRSAVRRWLPLAATVGMLTALAIAASYRALVEWQPDAGPAPVLLGVACATVIAHLWTAPDTRAGRALAWAPLRWVGRRSYGIYLLHPPITFLLVDYDASTADRIPRALLALVGTMIVAALSFRFVEAPMLRRRPGPRAGGHHSGGEADRRWSSA